MNKAGVPTFRVKVSSRGQVVIPKLLREAYGIKEGQEVLMIPVENGILVKALPIRGGKLRGLLADLDVDIKECENILAEARRSLFRVGL